VPRRAAPGNRAALEAALTPSLLAALEELRELLDLHDWRRTPLAPPFQAAAAVLEAARLVREGYAPGDALHVAADRLGLERETVRSWARRWTAASRRKVQHARAGKGSTPASLVRDAAHADTEPKDEAA
jgi:hypothetical protein